MSIGSARYFELAEFLPAYNGAVRVVLTARLAKESPELFTAGAPLAMGGAPEAPLAGSGDDIASLAALSQTPGFPGIEYQGG